MVCKKATTTAVHSLMQHALFDRCLWVPLRIDSHCDWVPTWSGLAKLEKGWGIFEQE